MSTTSLMQLEQCILTGLRIEPNLDFELGDPLTATAAISTQSDVRQHQSEPRFMVTATFTVTWADRPFYYHKIEIGLRGLFAFPEGTPDETMLSFVPLLCLTNLYGTARGIVAQATGMCLGGAFMLPLIDMNAVIQGSTTDTQVVVKPRRRKRVV